MGRNTEGLRRTANLRSKAAVERAQSAIRQMQVEEAPINFRTVSSRASVSTAWLYRTDSIRNRIMKLRNVTSTPIQHDEVHRSIRSRERIIETLRFRIKHLEKKNEELQEQLERVYGQLAKHK